MCSQGSAVRVRSLCQMRVDRSLFSVANSIVRSNVFCLLLYLQPQLSSIQSILLCLEFVSFCILLSGVFRGVGPLCEGPPFGRTAVIFVTILGLFLAPFRDKIAATSDQMRFFLAGKCSKMVCGRGLCPGPRWGSLQRSPSVANLFTVDSRRVMPVR